jgi:hypothetical protein
LLHVDSALNLAWALLSVAALVFQCWRERNSRASRWCRARHSFTVFIALVALFPCISASDDEMRLRDLHRQIEAHAAFDRARPDAVATSIQLEDLEHGQVVHAFDLTLAFCFVRMVPLEHSVRATFQHRDSLGRSPPVAV